MDTESNNGRFRVNEGDWICSDPLCANVNYARREACNRCSKERPDSKKKQLGQEIGKEAAEKSRGLFSADDWQCNKCGNVNWARRQTCNMCNAPKFGDVEERTGYGGGYNDRGVVEYIKRDESDDEYDQYGRRKKRKLSDCTEERLASMKDDEEEEEEDDDDEDGDLSKYDLSGWGETELASEERERTELKDDDDRKEGRKHKRSQSPCHASPSPSRKRHKKYDSTSSSTKHENLEKERHAC